MVNYVGIASAVSGVYMDAEKIASACAPKEMLSGWEDINNRLELLCGNMDRLAQDSWAVRVQLVGSSLNPIGDKPEKKSESGGDFVAITLANIAHIEDMMASILYDIQAIKKGRA